jgi:hypothetical protein
MAYVIMPYVILPNVKTMSLWPNAKTMSLWPNVFMVYVLMLSDILWGFITLNVIMFHAQCHFAG